MAEVAAALTPRLHPKSQHHRVLKFCQTHRVQCHLVCCWSHPEAPGQQEFPNGDRVTSGRQRSIQGRQAPQPALLYGLRLHGQHVPGAYVHHTLARHGILSAQYSLLAEAGLCLEPPNCSKEHLGTEARVSPPPHGTASALPRPHKGSSLGAHVIVIGDTDKAQRGQAQS